MANGVMLGTGTMEDPYLIQDAKDLSSIQSVSLNASYRLANNIDCSTIASFSKIGNSATPFRGSFDGNGFAIQNMVISSGGNFQGLFGNTQTASVKNVRFENCSIQGADHTAIVSGNDNQSVFEDITIVNGLITATGQYIGMIVGGTLSYGTTIRNIDVQGKIVSSGLTGNVGGVLGATNSTIVSSTIENAEVDVIIEADGVNIGGVIGRAKMLTAINTKAKATVSSTMLGDSNIGGFIGFIDTSNGVTFSNCRVTGSVYGSGDKVGGFIGCSASNTTNKPSLFQNCGTDVNVQGNAFIGGFCGATDATSTILHNFRRCFAIGMVRSITGEIGGFIGSGKRVSIQDCYSAISIDSPTGIGAGGFIGNFISSTITNCYSASTFVKLGQGFVGTMATTGASMSNCFFNVEIGRPQDTVILATPRTTAEMKLESTYSGWDFVGTWTIIQYPQLRDMIEDDRMGIRGVVERNKIPVGGATIFLLSNKDRLYRKTTSDANGEWVFKSVVPERDFVVQAYWSDADGRLYASSSAPNILPVVLM